jgi:hypothetical protein
MVLNFNIVTCNYTCPAYFCSSILYGRTRYPLSCGQYVHILRQYCVQYERYVYQSHYFHLRVESVDPLRNSTDYNSWYLAIFVKITIWRVPSY